MFVSLMLSSVQNAPAWTNLGLVYLLNEQVHVSIEHLLYRYVVFVTQ